MTAFPPFANGRSAILIGLCAVAIGLGGWWGLAAVGSAVGSVLLVRRARTTERRPDAVPLECVGAIALGPGAALHAVRFGDRFLLVGVTSSHVSLVDAIKAAEGEPAGEPARRPAHLGAIAVVALLTLWLPADSAYARTPQRDESGRQRVDLDAPQDLGTKRAPDLTVEPLPVAPAPLALPEGAVDASQEPVGGTLLALAMLSLLPFAVMGMSSFVKISVVLSLLRTALSTPQTPSDPVLATIALTLTVFVMGPVGAEAHEQFIRSGADPSTAAGMLAAAGAAAQPLRGFLERNARPEEIALFVEVGTREGRPPPDPATFAVLLPAFLTSELREAFVAGFLLFIPFLVLDMVVANILMSMGMVMVSPATVSLPLKIMLFVLVDGWPLLMKGLALGYQ